MDAMEAAIIVTKEANSGYRWFEDGKGYCAIITLDVKNAFSSADWDAILAAYDTDDSRKFADEPNTMECNVRWCTDS